MPEPSIDLAWWPPDGDEPIGEERAAQLVVALRTIAGPVVEAAVADLQARLDPGTEIVRSGSPVSYIARCRFGDPRVRSLCTGTATACCAGVGTERSLQQSPYSWDASCAFHVRAPMHAP